MASILDSPLPQRFYFSCHLSFGQGLDSASRLGLRIGGEDVGLFGHLVLVKTPSSLLCSTIESDVHPLLLNPLLYQKNWLNECCLYYPFQLRTRNDGSLDDK